MNFRPMGRGAGPSFPRLVGCLLSFGGACLVLGVGLGLLVSNPALRGVASPTLGPEAREYPQATNTSVPEQPSPVPTVAPTQTSLPPPPTQTPLPPRPARPVVPRLTVGGTAQVVNTGGADLRIRQAPNASAAVLACVAAGTRLRIRGGPRTDGARNWWQVSGFDARGTLGWGAGDYLQPLP